MTIRVYAPVGGGKHEINGKIYQAAEGGFLDVPDDIGRMLLSTGWVSVGANGVGATSSRPTTDLKKGLMFHDSTLGFNIVYDGKTWRNPATGAAV